MPDELDNLRPEVREAIAYEERATEPGDTLMTVSVSNWEMLRAELLRLTQERDHARRMHADRDEEAQREWTRAERAEAELAALKARIAESAHVEVTLGCAIDGEIPSELALCKVALVKVGE